MYVIVTVAILAQALLGMMAQARLRMNCIGFDKHNTLYAIICVFVRGIQGLVVGQDFVESLESRMSEDQYFADCVDRYVSFILRSNIVQWCDCFLTLNTHTGIYKVKVRVFCLLGNYTEDYFFLFQHSYSEGYRFLDYWAETHPYYGLRDRLKLTRMTELIHPTDPTHPGCS